MASNSKDKDINLIEKLISNNQSTIIKNLKNYDIEKPVKLIDFENNEIKYYPNNLNNIINLIPNEIPVSIISIIGAFRTGKSFILNVILKFLVDNSNKDLDTINVNDWIKHVNFIPGNNYDEGFKWCNGSDSQTMGIWIWNKPIIFKHPSKGEIAILLLDTQGLFDLNTNQKKTIMLFGISSLISSHIIFNVDKRIQEDNLQHLALFSAYGQLVNDKYSSNAGLQTLDFLIRDWQNFDEIQTNINNYSYSYLNKIFSVKQYDDMNITRNQIKNCFNKIDCFFLPHPGLNAISSKYNGCVNELNQKFTHFVSKYLEKTFINNELEIKQIENTDISAKDLSDILDSYISIFKNQEGFPEAQTILESTIKIQHNIAIEKSVNIFVKNADKLCNVNSSYIEDKKFENLITKNKVIASNLFDKLATLGSLEVKQNSKIKLIEKLNDSIQRYTSLNKSHKPFKLLTVYMIPIVAIILSYIFEKIFFLCSGSFVICKELYFMSSFTYYLTIMCIVFYMLVNFFVPNLQNVD